MMMMMMVMTTMAMMMVMMDDDDDDEDVQGAVDQSVNRINKGYISCYLDARDMKNNKLKKATTKLEKEKDDPLTGDLSEGTTVIIQGLVKAPQFNDKLAVVGGPEKDGRYPVRLVTGSKWLKVKRINIRVVRV